MKHLGTLFGLGAALALSVTSASAASYSFYHNVGPHYLAEDEYLNGQFNATSIDYSSIISGTLEVHVADDGLGSLEWKKVLRWWVKLYSPDGGETASVTTEGDAFGSSSSLVVWWGNSPDYTTISGALGTSALDALTGTGWLNFRVTATDGDLYYKWSKLTVETGARNVPDGGSTVALLGIGLLGLVALKRRRS